MEPGLTEGFGSAGVLDWLSVDQDQPIQNEHAEAHVRIVADTRPVWLQTILQAVSPTNSERRLIAWGREREARIDE